MEADRVDGGNLFGVLLRAPVLGLLHILGAGRDHEDDESEESKLPSSTAPRKSALKKCPSNLRGGSLGASSHISDIAECSEALDGMHLVMDACHHSLQAQLQLPKKQLSWSDESGQELVQVMTDEVSDSMPRKQWYGGRWSVVAPEHWALGRASVGGLGLSCPRWTNHTHGQTETPETHCLG